MPAISRENARIWVLFVVFLLTLLSRNDGTALIAGPFTGTSRLARQREAHAVLNSTSWGDFSPHAVKEGAPPGDAPRYLNLTGFREHDSYAWNDLDYFKDRCRQWSQHAYPSKEGSGDWDHGPVTRIWQNATGTVHGKWVRRQGSVVKHASDYNLTAIAPHADWPEGHVEWGWNVTGSYGTVLLRLQEDAADGVYEEKAGEGKQPGSAGLAREISAVANIQDEATSASSFAIRLHGVHWPRQGSILLTTTSDKFAGIFGLPHLAPGPDFFQTGQKLLNQTVDKVLRTKERNRFSDPSNPWTPVVEDDVSVLFPRCEYIMYLQLHPIHPFLIVDDRSNPEYVFLADQLENELRFPTGAPNNGIPDLRMSLVAWSPDCSYYLESKGPPLFPSAEGQHLVGVKAEVLLFRTKSWMFGFAAVMMGQLWLLKTQMKESNTPSTLGRISFQTAAMMLLADGLVFACSSAWSLSATNTFLPSLILTFAAFMSMSIGSGFLAEIYKNQEPERRNREREREQNRGTNEPAAQRASPAPASTIPLAPGSLPLPVTAGPPQAPSPPIIIPSDQDIDAEIAENTASGAAVLPTTTQTATTASNNRPRVSAFASISVSFVTLGIVVLILTAMSMSWPPHARAVYLNCLAFTYLSLWVPQIRRNIWRNSRRAFAWRFMVGQSVLRLLPFAYFYLRHDNILFVEPDSVTFAVLVGWVWCQLFVLAVQDVLGPRFGIPKDWMPEVWDYHPVLREDNVEAGGLPIGLVSSGGWGSAPSSPTAAVSDFARKRSWSDGGEEDSAPATAPLTTSTSGAGGARRREREKELRRHGMSLRTIDCAICTEVLEVPVVRANTRGSKDASTSAAASSAGGLVGVFARRAYMVTPCRHIFHTKCLEGWFRYKLQCPICREELPPL
jgi:hypothetical protein